MHPRQLFFCSFRAFCGGLFVHFDSDIDCLGAFVILSEARKVRYKVRFFYAIQIVIAVDGH